MRRTSGSLTCRLFRDSVQFRSGLVDLVEGVGCHRGGSHAFALAGELFVGRLTEHLAKVSNRGGEFRENPLSHGTDREPGDGGRRFVASEPVEKSGEDGQGGVWFRDSEGNLIGLGQATR